VIRRTFTYRRFQIVAALSVGFVLDCSLCIAGTVLFAGLELGICNEAFN
jgi:uncharacterized membrane protein